MAGGVVEKGFEHFFCLVKFAELNQGIAVAALQKRQQFLHMLRQVVVIGELLAHIIDNRFNLLEHSQVATIGKHIHILHGMVNIASAFHHIEVIKRLFKQAQFAVAETQTVNCLQQLLGGFLAHREKAVACAAIHILEMRNSLEIAVGEHVSPSPIHIVGNIGVGHIQEQLLLLGEFVGFFLLHLDKRIFPHIFGFGAHLLCRGVVVAHQECDSQRGLVASGGSNGVAHISIAMVESHHHTEKCAVVGHASLTHSDGERIVVIGVLAHGRVISGNGSSHR